MRLEIVLIRQKGTDRSKEKEREWAIDAPFETQRPLDLFAVGQVHLWLEVEGAESAVTGAAGRDSRRWSWKTTSTSTSWSTNDRLKREERELGLINWLATFWLLRSTLFTSYLDGRDLHRLIVIRFLFIFPIGFADPAALRPFWGAYREKDSGNIYQPISQQTNKQKQTSALPDEEECLLENWQKWIFSRCMKQ